MAPQLLYHSAKKNLRWCPITVATSVMYLHGHPRAAYCGINQIVPYNAKNRDLVDTIPIEMVSHVVLYAPVSI